MYGLRSTKRKDSGSLEEYDYKESYAIIYFQIDYPIKTNQTLYIIRNIEELGN